MPGGLQSWLLNPTFRSNLKMALAGKGRHTKSHLRFTDMSANLTPFPTPDCGQGFALFLFVNDKSMVFYAFPKVK